MTSEQWEEVKDRFHDALAETVEARQELLIRSCSSDVVRLEVERLLLEYNRADGFLEEPLANVLSPVAAFGATALTCWSLTGQMVSHYRVQGELGRGGMGVVYQAEDLNLGRLVAMKFLPGEMSRDPAAFQRLQREARAASSLDHSNICTVYELGEHQGQPFIVMQLLEGQTLRSWMETACEQDIKSRLNQALDIAVQITNGLEAAHQKNIIHRDIKPANIFITARGEAKLLDFGIAKLVDHLTPSVASGTGINDPISVDDETVASRLTWTGAKMGTAHYMSPEQIRGDPLDGRTDLFSLGLVIYEMVTGRHGFTGSTWAEIHESILLQEPVPARQLNPSLPAELERVIAKALKKDREHRYQSARQLGRDLEALRGELLQSVGLLKANRLIVAGCATVLIFLAYLGLVVQRGRQHEPAGQSLLSAKPRRSVAALGFHNLSGRPEDEWISTALAEMVSTELASGQQLRIIPGENVTRMKLDLGLPSAAGYGAATLKKIRTILGSDVIVQGSYLLSAGRTLRIDFAIQDAGAGETIATASETGSDTQIAKLMARAGASLREQLGISPIATNALDKNRATLPADPQAAKLYSEGVMKLRVFDALAGRDLLAKAIAVEPGHALSHSYLAQSLVALGYDQQASAEAKKASELSDTLPRESQLLVEGRYRQLSNDYPAALEVYRTLWKFFPDNLEYGLMVAGSQIEASLSTSALTTLAQLQTLPKAGADDPRIDLAEANARASLGDFKHALKAAASAIDKARAQGSRLLEAQAKEREGWILDRLGELDKALASYSEARQLAQVGGNLRVEAEALNGVANILSDKGDLESARKLYLDSLTVARRIGAQTNISDACTNIGNVFYNQGRLKEARRYYQEGLDIDRRRADKRGIASDLGSLANVQQGLGDLAAATSTQEQALQAFRDVGDKRGEATTLGNLGFVLTARGDLKAAKLKFDQSLTLIQQTGFQRGRGFSLFGLSEILQAQDRLPAARSTTLDAMKLRQELKDESTFAESQMQLAAIELEDGNGSKAAELARSAAKEFERQKRVDLEATSDAILCRALLNQGKLKEAQTAADHAMALSAQILDRESRFQAVMASAATKSKAGLPTEALGMLAQVDAETIRDGDFAVQLDIELLMGQAEIESGKTAAGRSRLNLLRKKAQNKDFNLVARQARDLLAARI